MTTMFFVDAQGAYIGAFGDGAVPPEGAVEVSDPPPQGDAKWTGQEWIVPVQPRAEWRLTARADRRSLVLAMAAAGILDRPNSAAAARGEWPPAFASALAGLPEELQLTAEVDWGSLTTYSRSNPVWALLGQMLNISPEQIDALFGYEGA